MKDELGEKIMTKFSWIKSKTYSDLIDVQMMIKECNQLIPWKHIRMKQAKI